jgi:hypothetical protein
VTRVEVDAAGTTSVSEGTPGDPLVTILFDPRAGEETLRRLLSEHRSSKTRVVLDARGEDVVSMSETVDLIKAATFEFADVEVRSPLSSGDFTFLNLVSACDPGCVSLSALLRAYERSFDWHRFLGRCVLAGRRGLRVRVVAQAHPAQAALVPSLRRSMEQRGLSVSVEPHPDFAECREVVAMASVRLIAVPNDGFEVL